MANLSSQDRDFIIRQIARILETHKSQNPIISNLTQDEIKDLTKIYWEFFQNIFKISENLYYYSGYFLPINHFEISVFWHKHNLLRLKKQTLEMIKSKDFIDVGGFIGDSAIIFEREFCDKNIYCFEPTKINFNLMQQTIALNNSMRIIPINKGLGAESTEMTINIAGSSSSICFESDSKESIEIATLDEFVRDRQIEIGFIKVDIEGFEMEFLNGAKETIATQKPAMLISIYHQAKDYFEIKPLIERWDLGYKFKICKGSDFSLVAETVLLCEIL
ncbi:FkbM family methyltransferase [Helicobacter sp. 23-1044]